MNTERLPELAPGSHRIRCPECGRQDRANDKTCGAKVENGKTVWHCFRCGAAGTQGQRQTFYRAPNASKPAPTSKPIHPVLASHWRDLWDRCTLLHGTIGEAYLSARCCALPPEDGDLRFCENLQHPSGYVGPALVALVTNAITRQPMTLHRTWIRADGNKAPVDPPRMLLGQHHKAGGVIRLWPDDCVTSGLAIAEGIETALSIAQVFKPVWAMIDAGNMAQFVVLPGIESLLIGADNDKAGIDAANACAMRWTDAGRAVRIAKSDKKGEDLNDVLRRPT